MKKILTTILVLIIAFNSYAQNFLQGSILPGTVPNTVDIIFLPNYSSVGDEYINYLSISIALPKAAAEGVIPTLYMTGPFKETVMVPAIPASYSTSDETIFSWIYKEGNMPVNWKSNTPFTGATISFEGGAGSAKVKLVDFMKNKTKKGGPNQNTYFLTYTNRYFDVTKYGSLFYALSGTKGSVTGVYENGDQYVETNELINLQDATELDNNLKLQVRSFPNPSNSYFDLRIKSSSQESVEISIKDIAGKLVQQLQGNADQSFRFGKKFIPGIYMVEVQQGNERAVHKLVKY